MESILASVKKMLGIDDLNTQFDQDLIIHINTVFSILNQLGVGPSEGFSITDDTANWNDFTNGDNGIATVKSYVFLKVRLLFDPPMSSAVTDVISRQISELEWRLNVAVDPKKED